LNLARPIDRAPGLTAEAQEANSPGWWMVKES
jgi:hypothetical protein